MAKETGTTTGRWAPLVRYKRPVLAVLLLLWGLLTALFMYSRNARFTPEEAAKPTTVYMESRMGAITDSIEDVSQGRPVNVRNEGSIAYYIYYAYLGNALGIAQGANMLLFVQMVAAFVLFLVYPLLIWLATKSAVAGFLSPYLLYVFCGRFLFIEKCDVYWPPFWLVTLSVPLLMILYRRNWDWKSWVIFGVQCLLISLTNVPRMHSALPVFLALAVVLYIKLVRPYRSLKQGWKSFFKKCGKKLAAALAGMLVSFFLLSNIVPAIYCAARGVEPTASSGSAWHALYLGMGYMAPDNPFGIVWDDQYAIDRALELDPEAALLTPAYSRAIRGEYFRVLREDPGFFIGVHARKVVDNVMLMLRFFYEEHSVIAHLTVVFAVMCLLWLYNPEIIRRYRFIWLLLVLVCIPFGMVEAMLHIPYYRYMMGSVAAVKMMTVLMVCAAAETGWDWFYKKVAGLRLRRRGRA